MMRHGSSSSFSCHQRVPPPRVLSSCFLFVQYVQQSFTQTQVVSYSFRCGNVLLPCVDGSGGTA